MSNLLRNNKLLNVFTRSLTYKKGKNQYNWKEEGIQYHGFKYYPRHEDFQDAPYEATKLFRIQRIKPVKGTPYWERNILKQLGLIGKSSEINVVKNIPEVNAMLWKVKHLIKIDPITYPQGFPKDEKSTRLQENGELMVVQRVQSDEALIASEQFATDTKRLDGDTLRRDSRIKWLNGWR